MSEFEGCGSLDGPDFWSQMSQRLEFGQGELSHMQREPKKKKTQMQTQEKSTANVTFNESR